MRVTLFISLFLCLCYACLPEPKNSVQTIVLRKTMRDPSVNHRFYHQAVGWDSVPDTTSLLYLPGVGQVRGTINVADIVLNRHDSIRIGIIHPISPIYDTAFQRPVSDYLLLSSYGVDSTPIAFDAPGVGPVVRRTFFRVGRETYRLASVDDSRTVIEIEPLKRGLNVEVTAELDLRYKKAAVQTLDGRDTSIEQTKDRELVLYFWGLGPTFGEDLIQLDSIYREVPPQVRPQLVAINRTDSKENVAKFLSDHQLMIPVYRSTPETCNGLNCHPLLPYGVRVNPSGRVVDQYYRAWSLHERLQALSLESR